MVTSDTKIEVPEAIDGVPVVSLGATFLKNSPSASNRTLIIPASVTSASKDALDMTGGITEIVFFGSFDVFNGFRWSANNDCTVRCADGYSFRFIGGLPMCFPDFDERILESMHRISESTVMVRLSDPRYLTEEGRRGYISYMRDRSLTMAEHAVTDNDMGMLSSVLDTGLLSDEDVMHLLERSVRSGKVISTSVIMSFLNRKS